MFDTIESDFQPVQELKSEPLVKAFIWAQWDMINQVLYHIHHRRIPVSLVSEDDDEKQNKSIRTNPTLSGLQFHDDLPHETVVNKLFVSSQFNINKSIIYRYLITYFKLLFSISAEYTAEFTSIINFFQLWNL